MKWIVPLLIACCLLAPDNCRAEETGSIYFSANGKRFATWFKETIEVGDARSRKLIRSIGKDEDARKGNWTFLGLTPDGRRLAVYYHWTGELKYMSLDGSILSQSKMIDPTFISPSFRWAVLCSREGNSFRYALASLSGGTAAPKYFLPEEVSQVKFSPGDKLLAYVSQSRILDIMNIKTGKYLKRYAAGDSETMGSPAFSPDGRLFAFADGGYTVKVVRLADWKTVWSLPNNASSVDDLVFSPDTAYLAVKYAGRTIKVYTLPEHRLAAKADFTGENAWEVYSMAFAPDSSYLALSGYKLSKSGGGDKPGVRFLDLKK